MVTFDFIIVGAGSAGCLLADALSADGQKTVLLLEAGGDDRRFWIKTPIGYGKTFFDAPVNWKFSTQPDPGLAGRNSYWPRGKVLGGSSSINAMVYCRGLPTDYDDWHQAGNPGWSWKDVAPVFARLEKRVRPDGSIQASAATGLDGTGALYVSDREPQYHPIKRFFIAGAQEAGLPLTSDMNGAAPEGVGAYQTNTYRGLRFSSAEAFLRPALRRPKVKLQTHALVHRVLLQDRRATGVEYEVNGQVLQASARLEVLLCAGAVNSPKLLQLSGIGPAALLQKHGLPVVHDNPFVGAGLQDHLGINYTYRATQPTLNGVLGSWSGRLAAGLRYVLLRSGPLSLSVNQMGGMVKSSAQLDRPDVQLYFTPVSYSTEQVGKRQLLKPDPYPGFIIGFNPCRPLSTGHIEIASARPQDDPLIRPHYLSAPQDIAGVLAGARLIGQLHSTPSMRQLIVGQPEIDLATASDAQILDDFRARSGTVYHPCGTCRMAPANQGGVVDAQLRVHGVQALRVVDASIFPNITSANTHAPTVMVAAQAARYIQQTYPKDPRP